jgi:hypothetical protein
MARGFHVRINVHDPEWLTAGHVADVAREQGQWLSALEVEKFIPAAVEAAKALMAGIEHGPFFVNIDGIDNFGVHGEATAVTVSVDTAATELPGQEPVTVVMTSETETEVEVIVEDRDVMGADAQPEETPSGEAVSGEA